MAANILGSTGGGGGGGAGNGGGGGGSACGVPLAGPVKIPRYSGDYTSAAAAVDSLVHLQQQQQPKSGQNNNGYVPYVDYTRDYNPPTHHMQHTLPLMRNGQAVGAAINHDLHIPSTTTATTTLLNGGGGNFSSLTRNRLDLRQDNGLPNLLQGSLSSLQNGLLGKQAPLK